MTHARPRRVAAATALVQGAYYLVTGVWPLLSMRTFQRVTGPKQDEWLVNTVGLLVAVVGGTTAAAAVRGRIGPEVASVAAGSAAALVAVDIYYVARGRIGAIYLADAVAELAVMAGWAAGWPAGVRSSRDDVSRTASVYDPARPAGIRVPSAM